MTDTTLFSAHPVTWKAVTDLYGEQAQVTGVAAWYHPERGWKDFPATSCMAMLPEHQVISLVGEGAVTLQLYIDVAREKTVAADFRISELYTPPPQPCSTSSTSPNHSAEKNTRPSTTSATSKATKPASRRASKSTALAGAPASPPPATSEESTTT